MNFDFRTYQAQSDLRRVAVHFGAADLEPITKDQGDWATALSTHLESGAFAFPEEFDAEQKEAIWLTAVSPDENIDACLAATALMQMDVLADVRKVAELGGFLELYGDVYRSAIPPVRAALMNGFARMQDYDRTPGEPAPTAADKLTAERETLYGPLMEIARSMSEEQIEYVVRANYGDSVDRHREALRDLLDSDTLAFPQNDNWYPQEVVQLISHVPSELGYIPCMSLILLDALRNDDDMSNAEFRFGRQWKHFKTLHLRFNQPFYGAIRYLYEADESWAPSCGGIHKNEGDVGEDTDVSIPWAKP